MCVCIYIYIHTHIHTHACLLSHVRLCNSMDCSPPGSSVHGIFPGKNTGAGYHFLLHIHNGILFNHKNKRKIYHLAQCRWTLKALCKVKCQTKKNKYCVISLMCGIKKKKSYRKRDQTCGCQRWRVGKGNWKKVVTRSKRPDIKVCKY